MKANRELMDRFSRRIPDPSNMRLVHISPEFPSWLNPFASDGVVIKAAGVPGEAPHSKWIVAYEGIRDGIERGYITPDTKIVEATSGNTGDGMAAIANALDLSFTAVMSIDVAQEKINAIRVLGRRTRLQLLSDENETTVEYARRLGQEPNCYNPCQYDGIWNPQAHARYLAPQLWKQQKDISLLFVPSGTMGTSMGLAMHAYECGFKTLVYPVLCAEGHEIPGARTLSSVKKDIRQQWSAVFGEEVIQFGTRHAAFYGSFLTWPFVLQKLGPSFGLAFAGALSFLKGHKSAGTLDQFREKDGTIQVVVFGPDECRPYIGLYLGVLDRKKELSAKTPPTDLLSVLEK
ncbi:MAG: pyridoxal-phosphate dependent enzyme [Candidatus Paceibacterota bacterium]|jgi:hypothetical protein